MLTGDNHKTAQKVAFELGITQFKAEVLPSDKSKIVREFQQKVMLSEWWVMVLTIRRLWLRRMSV
jgi:P-type E1-E2 ATPase